MMCKDDDAWQHRGKQRVIHQPKQAISNHSKERCDQSRIGTEAKEKEIHNQQGKDLEMSPPKLGGQWPIQANRVICFFLPISVFHGCHSLQLANGRGVRRGKGRNWDPPPLSYVVDQHCSKHSHDTKRGGYVDRLRWQPRRGGVGGGRLVDAIFSRHATSLQFMSTPSANRSRAVVFC